MLRCIIQRANNLKHSHPLTSVSFRGKRIMGESVIGLNVAENATLAPTNVEIGLKIGTKKVSFVAKSLKFYFIDIFNSCL